MDHRHVVVDWQDRGNDSVPFIPKSFLECEKNYIFTCCALLHTLLKILDIEMTISQGMCRYVELINWNRVSIF